ncbi:MAG: 30S ribosomal protein S6 [Deltaproteobacteria bacterium]|nr:MAG: 30S ribosomal protein S6 [Deltaproteobacteria bacterium]
MRQYETIYILKPSLSEEVYEEVIGKFNAIIEKNQGVMIKTDRWGERTLAYQLNKFNKGFYVLLEYCGNAALTKELERLFRLDDKVLKYQTVKLSDRADPEALLKEARGPEEETEVEKEGVEEEQAPAQDTTETNTEEV